MASKVNQRPTHYDTLGIEPDATADDIARAFARELHRPRAFGQLGSVSLAYETLREPERRKAYDRAIGLTPDPEPAVRPFAFSAWNMTSSVRPAISFAADERRVADRVEPSPEPQSEPAPAAASEPAIPDAQPDTPAIVPTPRPAVAERAPLVSGSKVELSLPPGDVGEIPWKRVGLAAGPIVLAVILVGAWTGRDASTSMAAVEMPEKAVTLSLPPAEPLPELTADDEILPEPRAVVSEARAVRRVAVKPIAKRDLPRPIELTPEEERELAGNAFVDSAARQAQPAAEVLQEEIGAPAVRAASMPLPDRVIARTIHRIGYSCGQVASKTASDDGAPGVFRINCTSGHSYRAQPVGGRYRFKRLGGR